jgi:hypothetical protein
MLIGGLAMMGTTLVAAAPQATTLQPTLPATTAQTAETPSWLPQQQTACNLLCIQGYYCCVKHNTPTCIPNDQQCTG